MRLLPQSLFGRLVWILVIGLIIAQFLSVIMREEDREEFFYQTRTIETARRISDIVAVRNALKPEDRFSVVPSLSAFSVLVSTAEPGPPTAPRPQALPEQHHRQRHHLRRARHADRGGQRYPITDQRPGRGHRHPRERDGTGVRSLLPPGTVPQSHQRRHRPGPYHRPQRRPYSWGELSLRNLPGGGLEAVLTLPRRNRLD